MQKYPGSNAPCDHNAQTSQTHTQTDGQTDGHWHHKLSARYIYIYITCRAKNELQHHGLAVRINSGDDGANLPTGLYILLALISSSLFFSFIFLIWEKLSQYLLDRFSRLFSPNGRYLCEFSWSSPLFSDSSRDVAMATNFVSYRTCSLGAKVSQDGMDRFSQSLHRMVGIELQMINLTFFFSIS